MIFPTGFRMPETFSYLVATSQSADISDFELDQSSLAKLKIDLDPRLKVVTLTPGRFANVIQKNNNARHALQVIRENMTSSFILNLEPDGSATVCRGWHYLFFNDGPQVHTSDHIREQLGYSGHWEKKGDWVQLNIKLDNSVCPRIGQYSQLIPSHSSEWRFRCLPIVPKNHPILKTPILACQLTNFKSVFGEDNPHIVSNILPGQWLILGSGNGLRIIIMANSVAPDYIPDIKVEYPPEPVKINSWDISF